MGSRLWGAACQERVTVRMAFLISRAMPSRLGWKIFSCAASAVAEVPRAILQNAPCLNGRWTIRRQSSAGEETISSSWSTGSSADILFVAYGAAEQGQVDRPARTLPRLCSINGGWASAARLRPLSPASSAARANVDAGLRTGLEWLWDRLLRQPRRWRRMLRLPRFVLAVRRQARR